METASYSCTRSVRVKCLWSIGFAGRDGQPEPERRNYQEAAGVKSTAARVRDVGTALSAAAAGLTFSTDRTRGVV